MPPTTASDISPPETLHTDAQVGTTKELRDGVDENVFVSAVSGLIRTSLNNTPHTYTGLQENPKKSEPSGPGASNRESKKVLVPIPANSASFTHHPELNRNP